MTDIDHGARARLDYIEKQLQVLFEVRYVPFEAAFATRLPPGVGPAVIELVRAGKTIAAIQEYRNATGAGLAEAKSVIEQLRYPHG